MMMHKENSSFASLSAARLRGSAARRGLLAALLGVLLSVGMFKATAAWSEEEAATTDLPPAQHVLDVAVENDAEEARVVISVDGMIEPKVFPHQGPGYPMVVVDIPGTTMAGKKEKVAVDSPLLQQVRIGRHTKPDKVRVVLDLLSGVAYDVVELDLYLGDPENLEETPTKLVVTLRKAPQPSSQ